MQTELLSRYCEPSGGRGRYFGKEEPNPVLHERKSVLSMSRRDLHEYTVPWIKDRPKLW